MSNSTGVDAWVHGDILKKSDNEFWRHKVLFCPITISSYQESILIIPCPVVASSFSQSPSVKFKTVLVLSFVSGSGPGPSAYSRAFCFRISKRMLSVRFLFVRVQKLKDTFSIIVRRNSRVLFSIFGLGANDLILEISLHSLCLVSPSLSIFQPCFLSLFWFLLISRYIVFVSFIFSVLIFFTSFFLPHSNCVCLLKRARSQQRVRLRYHTWYQSCRRPCTRPSVFVWRSHNGGWGELSRNEEGLFDKPELVICLYGGVETKKRLRFAGLT